MSSLSQQLFWQSKILDSVTDQQIDYTYITCVQVHVYWDIYDYNLWLSSIKGMGRKQCTSRD